MCCYYSIQLYSPGSIVHASIVDHVVVSHDEVVAVGHVSLRLINLLIPTRDSLLTTLLEIE